ncbi:hypothetical protein M9H77_29398 [Catharanthus roseus]|uniref:Uncharacterized protein n=1 Tax=Catharanthus roseus TaxID=4058 RepID=A0ACB9ZUN3_CATRO|nr:hypothetical protein M9H77_29398 [Catharanthus roseus]
MLTIWNSEPIINYNHKRTRFRKQYRGRTKGIAYRGNHISNRQAMTQNARRGGKLWVCIFPDKPVTLRPTKTRTASRKGSLEYWVVVVKLGRILYEMSGVTENIARRAISIATSEMPMRTQFIISG